MRRTRNENLLGRLLLHDVAVGAGAKRALRIDRLVMHRQNQHRQIRIAGAKVLQQVQSIGTLQRDVRNQDVRPGCGDRLHGGVRFFGLAADRQVRLLVDQQRQALTQ